MPIMPMPTHSSAIPKVTGRAKLGVQAFADALLVIPKVLAENSGLDAQDTLIKVQEEQKKSGPMVGIDIYSGEPLDAVAAASDMFSRPPPFPCSLRLPPSVPSIALHTQRGPANTHEHSIPSAAARPQGILDNYCVKKQLITSASIVATQLLLVDEVIRAGRQMKRGPGPE